MTRYRQLNPKLKPLPCPFCGTNPTCFPLDPDKEGDAFGSVACVNGKCPAQPAVDDGSTVADLRGPGAYIDMAIRKWNKRA